MLTEKIPHTRDFAKLKLEASEAKVEAFLFHEINCAISTDSPDVDLHAFCNSSYRRV